MKGVRVDLQNMTKRIALGLFAMHMGGCAITPPADGPVSREKLLLEAGFQKHVADSREKTADLQSMPQHELFFREQGGSFNYLYADAEGCHCWFTGTRQNLQRFKALKAVAEQSARKKPSPALDWYWP